MHLHLAGFRKSAMLEVQCTWRAELDPDPEQHREQLRLHFPPTALPWGCDSLDW